ncbi:hypothetical protein, partial [Galactobacillus timonensis]|uniref:hypothetical protein n=1 Tax=Galactobacillus timonensis TaxID=2041840 RepID=UPI00240A2FDE
MKKLIISLLSVLSIVVLSTGSVYAETEPTASPDAGGGTVEKPQSEVTSNGADDDPDPTASASTDPLPSLTASNDGTESEETTNNNAPALEPDTTPEPSAETSTSTDNAPIVKAMAPAMNAPMNAPASQSLFMIGSDGYDTL